MVSLPCFLPFLHLLSPLYLKVCCLLQVTCFSILLVLLVVIFTKKCGAGDVAPRVKALATKPGSGWIPRTHLVERTDLQDCAPPYTHTERNDFYLYLSVIPKACILFSLTEFYFPAR